MSVTPQHESAQAGSAISRDRFSNLSSQEALAIARDRFPNLCSTGILGRRFSGPPIDLGEIDRAMAFLRQCRKTKQPNTHSGELVAAIGSVSTGAVIASAVALGFGVHSFYKGMIYAPNALIAINRNDVRKGGTRSP